MSSLNADVTVVSGSEDSEHDSEEQSAEPELAEGSKDQDESVLSPFGIYISSSSF